MPQNIWKSLWSVSKLRRLFSSCLWPLEVMSDERRRRHSLFEINVVNRILARFRIMTSEVSECLQTGWNWWNWVPRLIFHHRFEEVLEYQILNVASSQGCANGLCGPWWSCISADLHIQEAFSHFLEHCIMGLRKLVPRSYPHSNPKWPLVSQRLGFSTDLYTI